MSKMMDYVFLFLSSLCFVLFLSLSVHGDQLKIGIKKSLRVPITRDPVKDEIEEINNICSCCCCCCFLCIREVLKTIEHTFERYLLYFYCLRTKKFEMLLVLLHKEVIFHCLNWYCRNEIGLIIQLLLNFFCTNYSFINLAND